MIRRIATVLAAAAMLAAAPAFAGEGRQVSGVVELFTSQGCNSCPPADRVLMNLAEEGKVLALGYHVDYWDYLGWKDTLGSPEYTERQYGYSRTFSERSVYTPQAVLNGRTHVNGGNRPAIDRHLDEMSADGRGLAVEVSVTDNGESVVINTGAGEASGADDAHLVLVYFDAAKDVVIERGENRGKTITYANIVTGIQTAGMWHGEAARFELPKSEIAKRGDGGCAVLLQAVGKDGSPGAILGAALLEHDAM